MALLSLDLGSHVLHPYFAVICYLLGLLVKYMIAATHFVMIRYSMLIYCELEQIVKPTVPQGHFITVNMVVKYPFNSYRYIYKSDII